MRVALPLPGDLEAASAPPRAGPPLCTALEPHPRSLGVAFLWPLAAWHQHLSGQLRGSRRCETAGRHGTELNLLGAGEKLTWQGPNHPPNLRPPPTQGAWAPQGVEPVWCWVPFAPPTGLVGGCGPPSWGRGSLAQRAWVGSCRVVEGRLLTRGSSLARTDACRAAAAAAGSSARGCGSLFRGGPERGRAGAEGRRGPSPRSSATPAAFHSASPFYFALFPVAHLALKLNSRPSERVTGGEVALPRRRGAPRRDPAPVPPGSSSPCNHVSG